MLFSVFGEKFGFDEAEVHQPARNIDAFAGRRTTFSVGLPCEHMSRKEEWVLFLNVGREFKRENWHVMDSDGRGRYHVEVDLPVEKGLKASLYYAVQWKGGEGRGLSREEWRREVGGVGWAWSGIMEWGE
jgi:hypothetical protein